MSSSDLAGWISAIAGVVALGVGVLQLRPKHTKKVSTPEPPTPPEPVAPLERPAHDFSHGQVLVTLRAQYQEDPTKGDTYTIDNRSPERLANVKLFTCDPRGGSQDIPEYRTYEIGSVKADEVKSGELSNQEDMCTFDPQFDNDGHEIEYTHWFPSLEKPENLILLTASFTDERGVTWVAKATEDSDEEYTYYARDFTAQH